MYRFLTISKDYSDRDTGVRSVEAEIICDSVTDLPTNTADLIFLIGSKADVISSGAVYKINSSGVWILQPMQSIQLDLTEYYTKTEIDDLFDNYYTKEEINSLIEPLLSSADVYRGTQIKATDEQGNPTDVNNLMTYGTYFCDSSATASQLLNCPITGSGFIMINYSNGNRVRLFLAVSSSPRMFIQAYSGSQWRTIKEFTLT